jgi:tetratricopeptide (TPR) repeat protein
MNLCQMKTLLRFKINYLIFIFWIIPTQNTAQTFYDHYDTGIKNAKKGLYKEALQSFNEAIKTDKEESERKRTYGVNFIEYYPYREIGIVYFELKNYEEAKNYLTKSIEKKSTPRAQEYLSKVMSNLNKASIEILALNFKSNSGTLFLSASDKAYIEVEVKNSGNTAAENLTIQTRIDQATTGVEIPNLLAAGWLDAGKITKYKIQITISQSRRDLNPGKIFNHPD